MITTDDCEFLKDTGSLMAPAHLFGDRFPKTVQIQSTHTGRIMTFTPITPDHPRYDEDGWDGEMALYEPTQSCNVKVLVLSFMQ